jgi:hypothetical protein
MKRLLPLFCIVVILFASAGVASANSSQPDRFTITGYTTSYDVRPGRIGGRTAFNITAAGTSSGYLDGPFTFKEVGSVDLDENFQGSGKGVNTGLITITKQNDRNSQVTIWYGGQLDAFAQPLPKVWGTWYVVKGTGSWHALKGRGSYTGNANVEPFTVVFTGKFD